MFMDKSVTRDDILARFQAARQKKRELVARLERDMKAEYEQRTGKTAAYFFAL